MAYFLLLAMTVLWRKSQSRVLSALQGLLMESIFLMKINELVPLDLQKLHLHCITVEYIKVMPAMLFRFSEISIYAY